MSEIVVKVRKDDPIVSMLKTIMDKSPKDDIARYDSYECLLRVIVIHDPPYCETYRIYAVQTEKDYCYYLVHGCIEHPNYVCSSVRISKDDYRAVLLLISI